MTLLETPDPPRALEALWALLEAPRTLIIRSPMTLLEAPRIQEPPRETPKPLLETSRTFLKTPKPLLDTPKNILKAPGRTLLEILLLESSSTLLETPKAP